MDVLLLVASLCVTVPVADLHVAPGEREPLASQAVYGTAVTRLEVQEQWIQVVTPDGYIGWMQGDEAAQSAYRPTVATANRCVFLYEGPDACLSPPVRALPFGVGVQTGETCGEWVAVHLVDGSCVWAHSEDLATMNQNGLSPNEMLALAQKFLGVPYLWGGTTSFGCDCSGLVQLLYGQMGIALPRDSALQREDPRGQSIERDRLQPGDLVFFQKPDHVGVYCGDGVFLGATPPAVRFCSLNEPRYVHRYLTARRFVQHG